MVAFLAYVASDPLPSHHPWRRLLIALIALVSWPIIAHIVHEFHEVKDEFFQLGRRVHYKRGLFGRAAKAAFKLTALLLVLFAVVGPIIEKAHEQDMEKEDTLGRQLASAQTATSKLQLIRKLEDTVALHEDGGREVGC